MENGWNPEKTVSMESLSSKEYDGDVDLMKSMDRLLTCTEFLQEKGKRKKEWKNIEREVAEIEIRKVGLDGYTWAYGKIAYETHL